MARRMFAILLVALIATGCSAAAQTSSPTANSAPASSATVGSAGTASPAAGDPALCDSLTALRTSFGNFAAVVTGGDVTAAQLKTSWDELHMRVDLFRAAASNVQETNMAQLRDSLDELKTALDDLNGRKSTEDKAQGLLTAVQNVITAFQETAAALNCEA